MRPPEDNLDKAPAFCTKPAAFRAFCDSNAPSATPAAGVEIAGEARPQGPVPPRSRAAGRPGRLRLLRGWRRLGHGAAAAARGGLGGGAGAGALARGDPNKAKSASTLAVQAAAGPGTSRAALYRPPWMSNARAARLASKPMPTSPQSPRRAAPCTTRPLDIVTACVERATCQISVKTHPDELGDDRVPPVLLHLI